MGQPKQAKLKHGPDSVPSVLAKTLLTLCRPQPSTSISSTQSELTRECETNPLLSLIAHPILSFSPRHQSLLCCPASPSSPSHFSFSAPRALLRVFSPISAARNLCRHIFISSPTRSRPWPTRRLLRMSSSQTCTVSCAACLFNPELFANPSSFSIATTTTNPQNQRLMRLPQRNPTRHRPRLRLPTRLKRRMVPTSRMATTLT